MPSIAELRATAKENGIEIPPALRKKDEIEEFVTDALKKKARAAKKPSKRASKTASATVAPKKGSKADLISTAEGMGLKVTTRNTIAEITAMIEEAEAAKKKAAPKKTSAKTATASAAAPKKGSKADLIATAEGMGLKVTARNTIAEITAMIEAAEAAEEKPAKKVSKSTKPPVKRSAKKQTSKPAGEIDEEDDDFTYEAVIKANYGTSDPKAAAKIIAAEKKKYDDAAKARTIARKEEKKREREERREERREEEESRSAAPKATSKPKKARAAAANKPSGKKATRVESKDFDFDDDAGDSEDDRPTPPNTPPSSRKQAKQAKTETETVPEATDRKSIINQRKMIMFQNRQIAFENKKNFGKVGYVPKPYIPLPPKPSQTAEPKKPKGKKDAVAEEDDPDYAKATQKWLDEKHPEFASKFVTATTIKPSATYTRKITMVPHPEPGYAEFFNEQVDEVAEQLIKSYADSGISASRMAEKQLGAGVDEDIAHIHNVNATVRGLWNQKPTYVKKSYDPKAPRYGDEAVSEFRTLNAERTQAERNAQKKVVDREAKTFHDNIAKIERHRPFNAGDAIKKAGDPMHPVARVKAKLIADAKKLGLELTTAASIPEMKKLIAEAEAA